jgi:3-methylfumaryl-CoA hydratase
MTAWGAWIGREEQRDDRIDDNAVLRWLAALDRDVTADGSVPQAYHWCLCLPEAPTAKLGADGHPLRDESFDSFLPPVPLPRRMWAASKVAFVKRLRPGQIITRTSRIASVTEKQGSSGTLVFAEVIHETQADGTIAVVETQSIVFRQAASKDAPPAPPPLGQGQFDPSQWAMHRVLTPTEPLLFRFSALTFNSHRIHYDIAYATKEEGYRGLVVHGPLTASLLLDLAQQKFGDNMISHFDFRGMSPAIAGEPLHLVLREKGEVIELGAFASDGRQAMSATARRAAAQEN